MEQETQEVVPGSEEYNQQMIDKFADNQAAREQEQVEEKDELPVSPMPENGYEKFYNKETGEYDWQNHAKELEYRLNQKQPEQNTQLTEEERQEAESVPEYQAIDIVQRAGLNPEELKSALDSTGDLPEEAYAALEKQGLRRDLVEFYVENLNYRKEAMQQEAMSYAGGEQEWTALSQWAGQNLQPDEVARYNEILDTPEWKVAIDALRVRREMSYGEPQLVGGNNSVAGTTFGYRSKAEMKADMSDPRYAADPAFRKEVMSKIASATWDLNE
jgi:superoxide dismutase